MREVAPPHHADLDVVRSGVRVGVEAPAARVFVGVVWPLWLKRSWAPPLTWLCGFSAGIGCLHPGFVTARPERLSRLAPEAATFEGGDGGAAEERGWGRRQDNAKFSSRAARLMRAGSLVAALAAALPIDRRGPLACLLVCALVYCTLSAFG
eukprot:SAG22_NODE_1478_length_4327_cov_3.241249_2_plen_152_part_00